MTAMFGNLIGPQTSIAIAIGLGLAVCAVTVLILLFGGDPEPDASG
jgi:hypothetical protein